MLLFWVNSVLKSLVSFYPSEESRGRAWPLPHTFFDQTAARRKKSFWEPKPRPPPPPLCLRVWMIAAPYLKVWICTVPLGVILCSHGIKLEKVGPIVSSFNPCLCLPSVATEDRRQFQCLLFLEFKWYEDTFWVIKKIANSAASPFNYSADIIGNCTSTARKLDYMETMTKTASENRDL